MVKNTFQKNYEPEITFDNDINLQELEILPNNWC